MCTHYNKPRDPKKEQSVPLLIKKLCYFGIKVSFCKFSMLFDTTHKLLRYYILMAVSKPTYEISCLNNYL